MKRLLFLPFLLIAVQAWAIPPSPPVDVAGEISTHNADTTAVHGITDTSKITTNAAVITDNAVVRGDGGANGVQSSAMSIDDDGKTTATATLNNATGNEIAYYFPYTVNKLTSGNDTGLVIDMTDTASPGTSNLIEAKVGGVTKFAVRDNGAITSPSIVAMGATSYFSIVNSPRVNAGDGASTLMLQDSKNFSAADNAVEMVNSTFSNTSGASAAVAIIPTYNQTSGTAANTDLLINRTETAVGSGTQNLIDLQVGGLSKFAVDNTGDIQQFSSDSTHGGYITKVYSASSGALTGATDTIELNIPSGWRITQCQLHVKTVVVDSAGDDTWSAELNDTGTEEAIVTGAAAAANTNVNHWADADTWGTLTDAETDILLTPQGGEFLSGEIEAHCIAQGFDAWDNE